MSGLPPAFSYYVSALGAGIERNSVRIQADNGETAGNNSSITFTLPTEAVVDLNSLQFTATLKTKNAVAATASVACPASHFLFRSCQFSLNGSIIAGQNCQNFGQVYEALRRATTSQQDAESRMSEYTDVPRPDTDGKFQASKSLDATGQRIQFNDVMGLQRSPNAGAWDTSIFGVTRLHLYLESDRIMLYALDSSTQNVEWELANIELRVDTLRVPPAIDDIVAARLASGASLDTVFPEIYSQVSSSDSNVRCSIAANSLDFIGWCPLQSEYLTATAVDASLNVVAAADTPYGPNYARFKLQNTSNAVPAVNSTAEQYNFVINGRSYPASGKLPVIQGIEFTKDCFSKGVGEQNLLFQGLFGADGSTLTRSLSYMRENVLANNCVVVHKLCLTAPAHETAERALTGLSTQGASASIQLQTQGLSTSDYVLIMGQASSVLSAMAGQQVSVQY